MRVERMAIGLPAGAVGACRSAIDGCRLACRCGRGADGARTGQELATPLAASFLGLLLVQGMQLGACRDGDAGRRRRRSHSLGRRVGRGRCARWRRSLPALLPAGSLGAMQPLVAGDGMIDLSAADPSDRRGEPGASLAATSLRPAVRQRRCWVTPRPPPQPVGPVRFDGAGGRAAAAGHLRHGRDSRRRGAGADRPLCAGRRQRRHDRAHRRRRHLRRQRRQRARDGRGRRRPISTAPAATTISRAAPATTCCWAAPATICSRAIPATICSTAAAAMMPWLGGAGDDQL